MSLACPRCGCTPGDRCVIDTGSGFGLCALAGDVPGDNSCSACVSGAPKRRLRMAPEVFGRMQHYVLEEEVRKFATAPEAAFLGHLDAKTAEKLRALMGAEAKS